MNVIIEYVSTIEIQGEKVNTKKIETLQVARFSLDLTKNNPVFSYSFITYRTIELQDDINIVKYGKDIEEYINKIWVDGFLIFNMEEYTINHDDNKNYIYLQKPTINKPNIRIFQKHR